MPRRFRRMLGIAAAVAAALAAGEASAQKTELLVYTALETDQIKAYLESFNKMAPDVDVKIVRDSTGVITAKLLAEKANPQADAIIGLAASSMEIFKAEGMLAAYAPKGVEKLNQRFVDTSKPPMWVGQDVWAATVCYNTVEGQKKGIPKPESWKDLTKPVYKGQITMPNPASSGTGYFDVTAWLQLFGEANGWEFMEKLHKNIAVYTISGSKSCTYAATGEFSIGLSLELRATQWKERGVPIEPIYPREGLGWDVDTSVIIKKGGDMQAARRVLDWSISARAGAIYARQYAIIAQNFDYPKPPGIPGDIEDRLIANDLSWVSHNRERILSEWRRRFESKSEKQ